MLDSRVNIVAKIPNFSPIPFSNFQFPISLDWINNNMLLGLLTYMLLLILEELQFMFGLLFLFIPFFATVKREYIASFCLAENKTICFTQL